MRILNADESSVRVAVSILKNGGTIIYPTDTLYGIGADATSDMAKEKVYEIKGRDFTKTLSICVSDIRRAEKFVKVSREFAKILEKFLPGPLTVIAPQKKEMKYVSNDKKIAIRIPDNQFALALLKKFGKPITATSANLSGQSDPSSIERIDAAVREKCDLVIDSGKCKYAMPSTVLDVEERKILREGAIKKEMLVKEGLID
jgi:L-threonylcarbamoyladenylate synthase